MTATSPSGPDPLAALPLLAEAGVSVYWQQLDGRTAWVADAGTREVWISRVVPRGAVLRALIEALEFLDDAVPVEPGGPRLVHSADTVEAPAGGAPPALGVVREREPGRAPLVGDQLAEPAAGRSSRIAVRTGTPSRS